MSLCSVKAGYLSDVQRGGVAVVQSDASKVLGSDLSVLLHVSPQVGTSLWAVAIAKLHAVAPANQLSPQVHVGS